MQRNKKCKVCGSRSAQTIIIGTLVYNECVCGARNPQASELSRDTSMFFGDAPKTQELMEEYKAPDHMQRLHLN